MLEILRSEDFPSLRLKGIFREVQVVSYPGNKGYPNVLFNRVSRRPIDEGTTFGITICSGCRSISYSYRRVSFSLNSYLIFLGTSD